MYQGLVIHSTVDRYLGCSQVRVIMNSGAVNVVVDAFLMLICLHFCWADNQGGFDPELVWLKSLCSSHDCPPPSSLTCLLSLHNTQ